MDGGARNESGRVRRVFGKFFKSERPWVNVSAQMHDHVMALEVIPVRNFYWDAGVFINALYEVAAYYQIDNPLPVADVYNFEVEALGAKMIYSDNAMPAIDHREPLIRGPEDLPKIKTPDFYHDARLPYALDYIKFSTEFGNKVGSFCAPFSLAAGLLSYPALIKNMRKRPQFTRDLFDLIIDQVLLPFIKVQKEYCGVTATSGADAWASIPNLSVAEVEDWVVPFNRKLMSMGKELGVTILCGNSGYYREDRPEKFDINPLLKSFDIQIASKGGVPSLTLFPTYLPDYPFQSVREYMAKYQAQGLKPTIIAVLDAQLLRDGPMDKIVSMIKRVIDASARDHELSILLSNIPADTPQDHVHAAVAAVHTYGRKPIADNLDEIEFNLPRRESFREWKHNQN